MHCPIHCGLDAFIWLAASLYNYRPAVQLGGFPRHFSGARLKGDVTLTAFMTLILDDSLSIDVLMLIDGENKYNNNNNNNNNSVSMP